jgi:hypothetical protein
VGTIRFLPTDWNIEEELRSSTASLTKRSVRKPPDACPLPGAAASDTARGLPLCKWEATDAGPEGHLQAATGPACEPQLCKSGAANADPGGSRLPPIKLLTSHGRVEKGGEEVRSCSCPRRPAPPRGSGTGRRQRRAGSATSSSQASLSLRLPSSLALPWWCWTEGLTSSSAKS